MARKLPRERIAEMLRAVLIELKDLGGEAQPQELFRRVDSKLDLSNYERGALKSGKARWADSVGWYSVSCVHAGYLRKSGRKWILTAKGEAAIDKSNLEFVQPLIEQWESFQTARKN